MHDYIRSVIEAAPTITDEKRKAVARIFSTAGNEPPTLEHVDTQNTFTATQSPDIKQPARRAGTWGKPCFASRVVHQSRAHEYMVNQ